jgi:hypothetical protein
MRMVFHGAMFMLHGVCPRFNLPRHIDDLFGYVALFG